MIFIIPGGEPYLCYLGALLETIFTVNLCIDFNSRSKQFERFFSNRFIHFPLRKLQF
jgi:hypothetical protein